MPEKRFVVQEHTTPEGVHWDLMLEENGMLTTFRLEERPQGRPDHSIRAEKIFDHPLRFLTYEGPVQQETGRVHIVDHGTYCTRDRTNEEMVLEISGEILQGNFTLTHTTEAVWTFAQRRV
jgi:hypothetical protein